MAWRNAMQNYRLRAKQAPLKTSAQQPGYFVNYWPQKRLIEVYELYVIR